MNNQSMRGRLKVRLRMKTILKQLPNYGVKVNPSLQRSKTAGMKYTPELQSNCYMPTFYKSHLESMVGMFRYPWCL